MGDHYVPKYYLEGFTSSSEGEIWVYDKYTSKIFKSKPKSVANENKLYGKEMECYLANKIEGPANNVLTKIKEQKKISSQEKYIFSKYIVTLMKRVPKGRKYSDSLVPQSIMDILNNFDQYEKDLQKRHPDKAHLANEIKTTFKNLKENCPEEILNDLWLNSVRAEITPKILNAVASMTWMFLVSDERNYYFTSDNPVFYFKQMGLGRQESEITFPLTYNIALWASWRADLKDGYLNIHSDFVKEINRRTSMNLSRFAFYRNNQKWILQFIKKDSHRLYQLSGFPLNRFSRSWPSL